ncbi:Stealth CR1 domain-containing protein [Neisseria dentiae]|uniref:Stealth CR1 domain-containing protein n=1 Tax=Neisseria dentiae TaxID=194197 RepID=UPI0035A07F2C
MFFRDYFNKKYPIVNNEQNVYEDEEYTLIKNSLRFSALEAGLNAGSEIDVVFTWVNSQDPVWRKKYASSAKNTTQTALYADDEARFSDHNELYYSVYSVQKFMPWVRNIYIVTDAQTPAWFDSEKAGNIRIVDHSEIIEAQYLPTFNSHVIEAHLHNIPGLSENFIYFNDDVFVARPLKAGHFFRTNGIASIFIADKKLTAMQKKGVMTPTLNASFNSINLLKRRHDSFIDMPLVHTYVPLKKSIYHLAWDQFEQEIRAFLPNRLRTDRDLNMATFLVPWLAYLEGKSVFTREICYYFNIRSPHALTQYSKLLRNKHTERQPHSFCANDFNSIKNIPDYQDKLISMLKTYYQI